MSVLNLPNTLTITRIVLIPIFVITVIYQRYDYSLILFIIASLTDALDGLIARLRGEKTALGSFLDPLADKFVEEGDRIVEAADLRLGSGSRHVG